MKKRLLIWAPLFFSIYFVGVVTAHFNLFPYHQLLSLKSKIISSKTPEASLLKAELNSHFTSPIAKGIKLRYTKVSTVDELNLKINQLNTPYKNFDSAYQKITIKAAIVDGNILLIPFEYLSKIDTAYAYIKNESTLKKLGILIIPGSGINQSSAILQKNKITDNYQCNIDDLVKDYGNCFIQVKPNEDFLAIHNGKQKIEPKSFVNYLLNKGGSYSAHYLVQSLALTKYLKTQYSKTMLCGLSQGGHAALLNTLQSNPDYAIIASGYSIRRKEPYMSFHDQLILPNQKIYSPEYIKQKLQGIKTHLLFTYGEKEKSTYGLESQENMTKEYFKEFENIEFAIHPDAHVYNKEVILTFCNKHFNSIQ